MARRKAQQARVVCGRVWDWRVRQVRRMAVREAHAHEAGTLAGACDAVSSSSWLGFARDWLFCLPMPFLWLLNEQNVDIQELQVLWA